MKFCPKQLLNHTAFRHQHNKTAQMPRLPWQTVWGKTEMQANADAKVKKKIIYAFINTRKHRARFSMKPHLHNSEDLIKRALTPNDIRLPRFRLGFLSAYQRDLKPGGEDLN